MLDHLKIGIEFRWCFITPEGSLFGPWVSGHTKKVEFPLSDLGLDRFQEVTAMIQSKKGSLIKNHFNQKIDPILDKLEYKAIAVSCFGFSGQLNTRIIGLGIKRGLVVTKSFIFDKELKK